MGDKTGRGGWTAHRKSVESDEFSVRTDDGHRVAVVYGEGNARAVEALPELIEALRYARRFVDRESCDVAYLDAVIAKARGE